MEDSTITVHVASYACYFGQIAAICKPSLDASTPESRNPMILHIATFEWKEDVTDTDVAELTAALTAMAAEIPEIRSYTAGTNLHLRPAGADYGVAAIVDDAAGLDAYLDHPLHKAVYEKFIGRMMAARAAAQLPISDGSFA
jgi:hypothetical protein